MTYNNDAQNDLFLQAFEFTIKHEGGYANNPNDYGGETIAGISRVYWPQWTGWSIIDDERSNCEFPGMLSSHAVLHEMIAAFYMNNFWNPIHGNALAKGNLEVAAEVFDAGVNMGTRRAVKFLQTALNVFNRNGSLYDDIVVDGRMGPGTLGVYTKFLELDDPALILKSQLLQRGAFYLNRAVEDSSQETFIRGWLNRLVMEKDL